MGKNIGGGYAYNETDSSASYEDEGFSVEALNDVEVSNPENGQALVYDSSSEKWVNESLSDGVPAVTADDIDKSLMVQEVKRYIAIVSAQTVTIPAYDPEDPQDTVMIELQAENTDLFVGGVILRETIIQDGETSYFNEETVVNGGYVYTYGFCKEIATNKVYYFASPGAEPCELTVSLDKETTSTAEWGKQYAVMISKGTQNADTGVYTFDKTYNEVISALRIMPVIFITHYDGDSPNQYFADYGHIQNGKYRIRLINNTDDFVSNTKDGFLMWDPG